MVDANPSSNQALDSVPQGPVQPFLGKALLNLRL